MALSTYELAQLGLAGAGAGLQAYGANQATKLNKEQLAMQQRLEALRNQQNLELQLLQRRDGQAQNFAAANPLGAEQDYARKQAMRAAIFPALQGAARNMGGPTDPGIQASFRPAQSPLANMDLSRLMQTVSPEATTQALTDRRTATAGLDPTAASYQGSLSAYGLGDTRDVTDQRTGELMAQEAAAESGLRQSAITQLGLTEQQAQELEKKGGSGFWKKLAKVGIIAGGAALMATGVGGPAGAAIIGAGMGAGSGAIDGGWKGALIGAGTGALTGGLGGGAAGAGAARAAGATTGQIVKQAILNPQTIAQMAGAGIGGRTGAAIGLGSTFLPGANYSKIGVPGAGFEGNTPMLPGAAPLDGSTPTSPFLEGARPTAPGAQAYKSVAPQPSTMPQVARTGRAPVGAPNLNFNAPGGAPSAPQGPPPPQGGFGQHPLFRQTSYAGAQPSLPPQAGFMGPGSGAPPQAGPPQNLFKAPGPYAGAQPGLPPSFGVQQAIMPPQSQPIAPMGPHSGPMMQPRGPQLDPARVQPGPIMPPNIGNQPVQGSPAGLPMGRGLAQVLGNSIPRGMAPTVAQYGPAGMSRVLGGPGGPGVPNPTQMPQGFNPQLQQMLSQLPDGALRQFLMRGGR
jgi:hypothetical protein